MSVYTEIIPNGLGLLSDAAFNTYLVGAKVAYEARIAEEKRIEEDRIAKEKALVLHNERREQLIPYWSFIPEERQGVDLSTLSDAEWNKCLDWCKNAKVKDDEEKEKQRLENERLKAEADAREKAIAVERKKQEEVLAAERAKAESERKAAEAKAAEEVRIEKEKAAKLEAELKAKAEAEAKIAAEAKKAANAPDLEKLNKLASDILAYELPTVQGEEAKKVIASTKELLEKVSKFITEKTKTLLNN